MASDVTDRESIDLASATIEDKRRVEYAVRLSGIGFWYCDLPFDELIWDERVKAHFFLPADARVTIDTFYARIVPDDRERTRAAIERSIGDRTLYDIVYRTHDPASGAMKWIRAMGGTTYGPDGSPTRFDGVTVDVTTQKREEEELERVSRAKDEFLATMSHELRTPLNAMLGWATMLRKDHSDPAKLARGLAVIERNAQAQARLVGDLLDMSRIISGKLQLSLKKFRVSAPIHAAADVVRPAAEAKGVRLIIDLDPELGETVGDPDRLQQIVWNLVANAVRFTPRQGRVTVRAQRVESSIEIEVVDTGAGIPAEHLPHIFERFRQVDSSTTRAHGGLGLGLAIVRHLVEAHGGQVTAKSEGAHRGATFTVTLPIRAVLSPRESAESAAPATTAAIDGDDVSLRGVTILLVDDDQDSLDLVRIVLESAGAVVVPVTSAAAALSERGPFDLIVSDIGMPEVDGLTLLRHVRSRDASTTVPAIALTAYARAEEAERALRAGFQEHITKPVDIGKLLTSVERWSRQRIVERPSSG